MKEFIRTGASRAVVTITIENSGKSPYKPNIYGSKIIIRRTFDHKSSNYKIKNEHGENKYSTREELNSILDFFEIVIDNPLAILSQDAARSFLTSSNSHSMYTFLSKGISHEAWRKSSSATCATIQETSQSYLTLRDEVSKLKRKQETLTKEFKELNDQKEIGLRLALLVKQIRWKAVENRENTVASEEKKLTHLQDNLSRMEAESQNNEAIVQDFDQETSNKNVELTEVTSKVTEAAEELQRSKGDVYKAEKGFQAAKADAFSARREVNKVQSEISRLEKALQAEVQRTELGGLHREQEKLRAKQATMKEKLKVIDTNVESLGDSNDIQDEIAKLKPKRAQVQAEISDLQQEINDVKASISSLKAADSKFENVFGGKILDLLSAINQCSSHFSSPPLGPVGRYITLKDPDWISILGRQLRKSLNAFVVENSKDRATLIKIMRRVQVEFPIIVSKSDMYSYEQSMPDRQEFKVLLDVLEFSNEHIKRVMIDQHNIERIILIKDRNKAESVMYNHPRNVFRCLALQNERSGFLIGGSKGASSSAPIYGVQPPYQMRTEKNDPNQMRYLEDKLRALDQKRMDRGKQLQTVTNEIRQKHEDVARVEESIRKLRKSAHALQKELEIIEDKLSQDIDESQRTVIEGLITEEQNKLDVYKNQLEAAEDYSASMEADYKDFTELCKQCDTKVKKAIEVKNSIEDQIYAIRQEKEKFLERVARAEQRKAKVKTDIAEQEAKVNSERNAVELLTQQAMDSAPERITVAQSMDSLQKQHQRAEIELQKSQARSKSRTLDVVSRELVEAKKEYMMSATQFKAVWETNKKIDKMYSRRDKGYHEFLMQTTKNIQNNFANILRQRDFEGDLQINHEDETMIVRSSRKGQGTKAGAGEKDIKGLSGGEKSFSQIALLLAVWSAMSCHIRGLDEWDVFMDEVTRSVSMRLMVDAINDGDLSKGQTIFITPNPMTEVADKQHVKIFRLADPRR